MAKKGLQELTSGEVSELIFCLKQQYKFQTVQRKRNKIAKYIQFPKTPSILTETIALNLVRRGKILPKLEFISGHRVGGKDNPDLRIETRLGPSSAEVKGTGDKDFQNLTAKDILSPYVIWIRFKRLFLDEGIDDIDVLVIKNPSQVFVIKEKEIKKLNAKDVLDLPVENRESFSFSLKEYCEFAEPK
jgi:hypothetical protein